jgi:hypothetical protein
MKSHDSQLPPISARLVAERWQLNPVVNILQQPFVQVALPIIVAITLASWLQNKRFDDINRRFDETARLLDELRADLKVSQPLKPFARLKSALR